MIKMTRRHVIATLSSTSVLLCPALLNAQTVAAPDWADVPTDKPLGETSLINVDAGPAEVDVSALKPGEVAVIARPTDDEEYAATGMIQYIAVMHRTEDQIAFAADNARSETQDPRYFVVNLLCTHRGKAIGITGNPDAPFACTDRGSRHGSIYNAVGFGVAGASEDEFLSIPDHTLTADGDTITVALA